MIAKRGIQPIVEVTKAAKRIRSTTLNERIESGQFPSELTDLVDTFNEMLNRLQESFDRLSQFSADIAHELRTPVNNMRGEARPKFLSASDAGRTNIANRWFPIWRKRFACRESSTAC